MIDLTNMSMQEMFDRMCYGLKSQDWEPCMTTTGICVYDGPNNTHCAIGWLAPGQLGETRKSFHTLDFEGEISTNPDFRDFLMEAQNNHDINYDFMRKNFKHLATKYDLKWPFND